MLDLFGQEIGEAVGSEWAADLATTLKDGVERDLPTIYRRMEKLRRAAGRSWPRTAESTVRCTLQRHSKQHPHFAGGADLFRMVVEGVWRLK